MGKKYYSVYLLVFFLFVCDRLLKYWFLKNPDIGINIINNLIKLQLGKNQGIAFGFLVNQRVLVFLLVIIIFVLLLAIYHAHQNKVLPLVAGWGLIITGAISNLIDRLKFGFVVDYIDVSFFTVFNLADAAITFGVVIILIFNLSKKNKGSVGPLDLKEWSEII